MLSLKIHESYRRVVALCDSNLIGKKFFEDKRQLDLRENFYKDKEISFEDAVEILQRERLEDSTFNIVGEKAIKAAIEALILNKEGIGKVDGVPFALILI